MLKDYTHIVLVVDRSGSMSNIRFDAEGGINDFIKSQKSGPGKCTITLYDFDTHIEKKIHMKDVVSSKKYELHPRGFTALYDAIGIAVKETGEDLRKLPESLRPETVIVCIVTDGHENSSKKFTLQEIKEMITHQKDVYKWDFVFNGADVTAIKVAENMGFNRDSSIQYDTCNVRNFYGVMSCGVSNLRSMKQADPNAVFSYTDKDRENAVKPS